MRLEAQDGKKNRMSDIRENLKEMNDTDGQGDHMVDDGTQGHPSPFQVRTT